jgi:transcriptional regulator with XRE-family HTH domain
LEPPSLWFLIGIFYPFGEGDKSTILGNMQMPITGVQVRMARAALNWTVQDLAARAAISKNTVTAVEAERSDTHATTLAAIERVLVDAGIEFLRDDSGVGVRLLTGKRRKSKS